MAIGRSETGCWDQFLSMAFAQLTHRESLRDIEACLRSVGSKLYDVGFRGKVTRSTLADANESRDWRIYADFAQVLIRIARPLYARDPIGVDLDQSLYALDSTTIDLCLSLFPCAEFRRRKAAVKMHTLLDLRGNIPTFIRITDGKTHDVNILDEFLPEPGAFYVMVRWAWRRVSTKSYRFSALPYSRKRPFYRPCRRPTPMKTYSMTPIRLILFDF